MLRSGYSSEAVLQELAARKFSDTVDSTLETELLKAGATQPLIEALRSGAYQASASEVAIAQAHAAVAQARATAADEPRISNPTPRPNFRHDERQGSMMYDHLKDDLVYWHEGALVPFDNAVLEKKKVYLLFFSAFGSKEGRKFTARLVEYYNRVAPRHPEFEIIFFSADRSEFAMQSYISETNMPWPAVAYDKRSGKAAPIRGNLVHQVPHLIVVNNAGEILSDSGENPPNYDKILADLDKILGAN
jgi:hypothetical protein